MRCLHCGKRLSLLRKFSDGEFCSAEHRSLFDRLNNDLGLQRLIASQGLKEREKPPLPKKAQKLTAAEAKLAAETPPLGELVQGPPPNPIVARHVNQPGVPHLLGPKEAQVPQAQLRSSIRGLTEFRDMLSAPLPGAPMESACSQAGLGPVPLDAAGGFAGSIGSMEAGAASNEPRQLEELKPLEAGKTAERPRECRLPCAEGVWVEEQHTAPVLALGLAGQAGTRRGELSPLDAGKAAGRPRRYHSARPEGVWAGKQAGAPRLALRVTQQGTARGPESRHAEDVDSGEGGKWLEAPDTLCCLPAVNPLRAGHANAVAAELAGLFRVKGPVAPSSRGRATTGTCLRSSTALSLSALSMRCGFQARSGNPDMQPAVAETAKPRLRFRTERVDEGEMIPAAAPTELLALALSACATGVAAKPALTVVEAAPLAAGTAVAVASGRRPLERGFDLGGLEGLAQRPAEMLRSWHEPGTAPLSTKSPDACVPALGFRPELPTASEALEIEVLGMEEPATAAEPVVEAVKEPEEPAPPLHDHQRRFGVLRPMEKAQPAPACPLSSQRGEWRMSLEAAATCPRLKMKLDHADGSGSRSLKGDLRSRGTIDRFKSVQDRIPGGRFWRSAPADLKWIGLALPLILALVVWSFRGSVAPVEASLPQQPDPSKTVIAKQVHKFQQVLLSRAAIRLIRRLPRRAGRLEWQRRLGEDLEIQRLELP